MRESPTQAEREGNSSDNDRGEMAKGRERRNTTHAHSGKVQPEGKVKRPDGDMSAWPSKASQGCWAPKRQPGGSGPGAPRSPAALGPQGQRSLRGSITNEVSKFCSHLEKPCLLPGRPDFRTKHAVCLKHPCFGKIRF